MSLYAERPAPALFCENETNNWHPNKKKKGFSKDGIHDYLVNKDETAVNKQKSGTKAALNYDLVIDAGSAVEINLRLAPNRLLRPFANFQSIFNKRKLEANEFYHDIQKDMPDEDAKKVQRQALAGMLWNKQFYYYDVDVWINGDPAMPAAPARKTGRNYRWMHLHNADIISMPDKWEYPWYAAWDLAFHDHLSLIDLDFPSPSYKYCHRQTMHASKRPVARL